MGLKLEISFSFDLQYLLMYMPDTDWHNYPEELDNLMSWSDVIKE